MREILLHGKFEFSRQNYNVPKIFFFTPKSSIFFQKGEFFGKSVEIQFLKNLNFRAKIIMSQKYEFFYA